MYGVTSGSSAARDPPGSTRPSSARALLPVVIREFVWPAAGSLPGAGTWPP
jgi:hypothetical protein